MANYPFKINIETGNGNQYSFYTSSFATDADAVVSSSVIVDRINSIPIGNPYIQSEEAITEHASKIYSQSNPGTMGIDYLSASFQEPNTGSITFTDTEVSTNGGLKFYTFWGTKVCSVLGLPEGMPIYTENFKLSDSSTDPDNYISGKVISDDVAIKDSFKMSPQGRVRSNLIWDDAFGEGYVQWVSGSTTKQFMGYDPVKDLYNIGTGQVTASSATFGNLIASATFKTTEIQPSAFNFMFNADNISTQYVFFDGAGGTPFIILANGVANQINLNADTLLSGNKLFLDAGHTYIQESSNDVLDFYVGGDNMLKIDEGNNAITMPQQPCFHVHKNAAQTPGVSTADTIVTFQTERTDAASNFASNTFTAPVDGTYLFQATLDVRTIPSTTDYFWCKIVTSNQTYFGDIFRIDDIANAEVDYFSLSCTAIADMDASDTAVVKIQSANAGTGWKVHGVSGQVHSFFQGYLIG